MSIPKQASRIVWNTRFRSMFRMKGLPTHVAVDISRIDDDPVDRGATLSSTRQPDREQGRDPIADFADSPCATRSPEHDVGLPADVGMRVGDGDTTPDEAHGAQIVDVVADVHDLRRVDSSPIQQ